MRALFAADYVHADESTEGDSASRKPMSGLTKGLIIGGVVIGTGALLANEFKDSAEDATECVVNAIFGLSDCPPQ